MPITPAIIEAANTFRARLLARERRAAGAMARYYGTTWQQLQGDITALSREVDALRLAGEEVTRGQIVRLERMRAIQAQVETELHGFAQYADEAIVGQKRESIFAGERESAQLIEYAFPPGAGINISHYQMPRAAVENLAGFLQDGSPLRDIITGYVGSAADAFGETMVTGLAAGLGPRQLARELRQAYGMGLTDALRLSRTENLRAYRTASRQTYEANSDIVKGWQRHAAKDDRVCLACIMLDGKLYELATDMDDHVMGRCAMLPVTKTYAELGIDAPEPQFQDESAREWFERQPESVQREMMGAGKFDAWQDGKFTLDDIPQLTHSDVWGDSWTPKPLYELLGESAPVGTYADWAAQREPEMVQ
jgi:SPP1 gp7 family putative phage head morphogenesis protein